MGQSLTSPRSLMFHGDEQPDIKSFDLLLKPQTQTSMKLNLNLVTPC